MRAIKRFHSGTLHQLSRRSLSESAKLSSNVRSSILGEDSDELEAEDAFDRGGAHFGCGPMDFEGVIGRSAVMDKADFANARVGDVLEIPYEVTAGEFWRV